MATTLPTAFADLATKKAPKVLIEALKLFGTREIVGPQHSAEILGWAKKLGMSRDYTADEIPWCGLAAAIVVFNAGYKPVAIALRALAWVKWGLEVARNIGTDAKPRLQFAPGMVASLGDILVFVRPGGGHVGIYVGEDATCYWVLGGNQGNSFCIVRIEKARCVAIRRSPWAIGSPDEVKPIWRVTGGAVSTNEA